MCLERQIHTRYSAEVSFLSSPALSRVYSKRWLNQQKAVKEPLRRRETESQIKERPATESKSNLQLKRKLDDSIVVIEELDNEIKLLTNEYETK